MATYRAFAIVPAAGRSQRMGARKLLLDVGGHAMIDAVLQSWCASAVDSTVVVARADDAELIDRCRRFNILLVATHADPPEMRDSLVIGLGHIERLCHPQATDAWLVAPADLPGLTAAAINEVLSQYDPEKPRIVAASVDGRRRHPVLLPWSEAAAFRSGPAIGGLDYFLSRRSAMIDNVELDGRAALDDIDAPDDLLRWTSEN